MKLLGVGSSTTFVIRIPVEHWNVGAPRRCVYSRRLRLLGSETRTRSALEVRGMQSARHLVRETSSGAIRRQVPIAVHNALVFLSFSYEQGNAGTHGDSGAGGAVVDQFCDAQSVTRVTGSIEASRIRPRCPTPHIAVSMSSKLKTSFGGR